MISNWVLDKNKRLIGEECRARSDCTYVQSDLAIHSSQNKPTIANGGIRLKPIVESISGKKKFALEKRSVKHRKYGSIISIETGPINGARYVLMLSKMR